MARLAVTKCQGTGNDFVLVDRTSAASLAYPELAQALCDRRFGVGADGLLVLEPASRKDADAAMRIFNADGSEAEMCGNGVRCVARYLYERRPTAPRRLAIETAAGLVRAEVVATAPEFAVRVAMGVPEDVLASNRSVNVSGVASPIVDVLIGNPHSVAFFDAELDGVDLPAMAREIAAASPFRGGVNVEIARVRQDAIAMRVFERGVGETWACGTGACAVSVAAISTGNARSPVRVEMLGGDVVVDWGGRNEQAYLTGGARIVFDADVDVPDSLVGASAAPA